MHNIICVHDRIIPLSLLAAVYMSVPALAAVIVGVRSNTCQEPDLCHLLPFQNISHLLLLVPKNLHPLTFPSCLLYTHYIYPSVSQNLH